ncbi:phosphoserine phosphatase SerB [Haloferula luteola]|uniref:phosphoserine phosphatase n=1 Tax=Haloferula luteola TaxID=595692 RepID=A0A840UYW8_9BACT|nr:HAD-IB family phosphatase [Haloferula luteola]MBB5350026.1 phosphoserine phosphatase SerB [Haloferula luteola]
MTFPKLHLEVSIDHQRMDLFEDDQLLRSWPVSTAARGQGCQTGSLRTPTGRFVISEKIGEGCALHTRFISRLPVGIWDNTEAGDPILSRILWLDGLDADNANTHGRFIYIHGTHQESRLGHPASHGCIRMANADVVELFDRVPVNTPVIIHPPSLMQRKLIFFDCDSTLSTIEGIDELARAQGPETFAEVEALTHAAMNGEVPIHEVFPRRMEIIRPNKALCDQIAQTYVETLTEGVTEVIRRLQADDWTVIILSGGFKPLIEPLASALGIEHVEAVPLVFDNHGEYLDYGRDYPTTRNGGKPQIIKDWRIATHAAHTIMVGDGISDLESRQECDLFIGFGGVVVRKAVQEQADYYISSMSDFPFDALP